MYPLPEPEITCSLCEQDYKLCVHPWELPFCDWEYEQQQDLAAVVLAAEFRRFGG